MIPSYGEKEKGSMLEQQIAAEVLAAAVRTGGDFA